MKLFKPNKEGKKNVRHEDNNVPTVTPETDANKKPSLDMKKVEYVFFGQCPLHVDSDKVVDGIVEEDED